MLMEKAGTSNTAALLILRGYVEGCSWMPWLVRAGLDCSLLMHVERGQI